MALRADECAAIADSVSILGPRHWDQLVVVYVFRVLVPARASWHRHLRNPARRPLHIVGWLLLLGVPCFGFAACAGGSNAASSQHSTTTASSLAAGTQRKGESAVNVPMRVTYGSGSIGASDPATTLPNERGQTIQPGLNPGQNIIIKAGRVFPETLESSGGTPVVWYNLSKTAQRIIFNNQRFFPVDSGPFPREERSSGLPLPEVP